MSISFENTIKLVRALLRGITSDNLIDPEVHASEFQGLIFDWGGEYIYDQDFRGEVSMDGDTIMIVHWDDDGVTFHDHHEHENTMDVIRLALHTMERIQEGTFLVDDEDDDTTDWDDWV